MLTQKYSSSTLKLSLFVLLSSFITSFTFTLTSSTHFRQFNNIISSPLSTTHVYSTRNKIDPIEPENENQKDQTLSPSTLLKREDVFKAAKTASFVSLLSLNNEALAEVPFPYPIQKTDDEWAEMLSPKQYDILRKGGTEKPYSSILEKETRNGVYKCAGCNTPLFLSKDKFKSGTGWPSFAASIEEGVEIDNVSDLRMNLVGAELRCKSCGGHLGDVFNDGFLFVGTPAFKTGKRFCIDGYAMNFYTKFGLEEVRGDA